jgi:hypothetical protein
VARLSGRPKPQWWQHSKLQGKPDEQESGKIGDRRISSIGPSRKDQYR